VQTLWRKTELTGCWQWRGGAASFRLSCYDVGAQRDATTIPKSIDEREGRFAFSATAGDPERRSRDQALARWLHPEAPVRIFSRQRAWNGSVRRNVTRGPSAVRAVVTW